MVEERRMSEEDFIEELIQLINRHAAAVSASKSKTENEIHLVFHNPDEFKLYRLTLTEKVY